MTDKCTLYDVCMISHLFTVTILILLICKHILNIHMLSLLPAAMSCPTTYCLLDGQFVLDKHCICESVKQHLLDPYKGNIHYLHIKVMKSWKQPMPFMLSASWRCSAVSGPHKCARVACKQQRKCLQ